MTKNQAAVKKLKQDLAQVRGELLGTAANDGTTAGTDMEDGSVFVGTTPDGKQIYAMPLDLGFTATFNEAAEAVKKLNEKKALGHDDWQIPDLDTLKVLQRNQNQGSLKDTFNTTINTGGGLDFPRWYWSSTEYPDHSSGVYLVRFSDGYHGWNHKDGNRLSCRPVRLVDPPPSRG